MVNFNLSNALKGNKNAAGPHLKRAGAAIKAKAIKILGPVKKASGARVLAGSLAAGATVDSAIGAFKGSRAIRAGSKALGVPASRGVASRLIVGAARTGVRTGAPLNAAIGGAVLAADQIGKRNARKKSALGRIESAASKAKSLAKTVRTTAERARKATSK